jgi:hypothetical protein
MHYVNFLLLDTKFHRKKKGYKSNKRIDTSSSYSVDDYVIKLVADHKDVNEKAPVVHVIDQGPSSLIPVA